VAANSDAVRHPQVPPEVFARDWRFGGVPVGEFIVLARVDMGCRAGSFVERDARQRLLANLAPLDRMYPGDWRVLPGHVTFRHGRWVGNSAFENIEEEPDHRRLRAAAEGWLAADAAAIAGSLSAGPTAEMRQFLELYEWDVAHRSLDALSTLLLAVRTIETISMSLMGGIKWSTLLSGYRPHLAWSDMKAELADVAWHTLYSYEANPVDARRRRLREIFLELVAHGRSGSSIDLALFVARLPELCALWDGDGRHRSDAVLVERLVRVEELDRLHALWTDSVAFSKRLTEADDGLQLEVTRLVRLRNAAQHGGPLADISIGRSARLADRCRRQLLGDVLGRLLVGDKPGSVRSRLKELDGKRRAVLAASGTPVQALAMAVTSL
jgi:hypothetical protein